MRAARGLACLNASERRIPGTFWMEIVLIERFGVLMRRDGLFSPTHLDQTRLLIANLFRFASASRPRRTRTNGSSARSSSARPLAPHLLACVHTPARVLPAPLPTPRLANATTAGWPFK